MRCYTLGVDPRGFPTTLPEFQSVFPNEDACARYLETLRWPDGFACLKCGKVDKPYRFPKRTAVVLRCRGCQADVSLTAGTVMQRTHTPLSTWFWGAYLVTTQTPGQSALQFQRQLGIGRYETAFTILHKLRAGMVRPDRDTIGGQYPVEVDETLVGGQTRGEGRGVHHKSTVVAAVEVLTRRKDCSTNGQQSQAEGKPFRRKTYAGRLRLRVVPGRGASDLIGFVTANIAKGTVVKTDGWQGYADLPDLGYDHKAVVIGEDQTLTEKHLPLIHIVFANLKTWLSGTHHGRIEPQHLQAYLNEYVFRFNRRFYPMTTFHSVLGLVARVVPPTYVELYSKVGASGSRRKKKRSP